MTRVGCLTVSPRRTNLQTISRLHSPAKLSVQRNFCKGEPCIDVKATNRRLSMRMAPGHTCKIQYRSEDLTATTSSSGTPNF